MGTFRRKCLGFAVAVFIIMPYPLDMFPYTTPVRAGDGRGKVKLKSMYRIAEWERKSMDNTVVGQDGATENVRSIGIYELTFYCLCPKCCGKWSKQHPDNINNPNFVQRTANGLIPQPGRTVAADRFFEFGVEVYLPGFGWRTVEDRGGKVNGKVIDVLVEDHQTALRLGRQKVEVFIKGD